MPQRRPLPPDTRPDWRDPDMPVLLQTTKGLMRVTSNQAQRIFAERIRQIESMERLQPAINWRNDPTYNLRRK